jgi:hypothetical protein
MSDGIVPRACSGNAAVILHADEQVAERVSRTIAKTDDGFHEIIVAQGVSLLSLELDVHGFALLDELE